MLALVGLAAFFITSLAGLSIRALALGGAACNLLLSTAALVGLAACLPWDALVIALAASACALIGRLGAAGT